MNKAKKYLKERVSYLTILLREYNAIYATLPVGSSDREVMKLLIEEANRELVDCTNRLKTPRFDIRWGDIVTSLISTAGSVAVVGTIARNEREGHIMPSWGRSAIDKNFRD